MNDGNPESNLIAIREEIDAADRLHGYGRVIALGDLALKYNGVDFGDGDLGVLAAVRIRRSGTRGPVGRLFVGSIKDSDFILYKMAVARNNFAAASAIARVRYYRRRSVNKGRNATFRELEQAAPSRLKPRRSAPMPARNSLSPEPSRSEDRLAELSRIESDQPAFLALLSFPWV